jgi:protein-S-isoprenylcysteine O-methyltransferase Ste14
MFLRALLAFIALPGLVAFAVPISALVLSSHTRLVYPLGLIPLVVGIVGLLWCVRDFYVAGRGTLAPWSPPKRLVVVGLYRYSRNPMYICVALILVGWAVAFASTGLGIYALCVAVGFHIRVIAAEEPYLATAHGDDWARYTAQVRRWI